MAQNGGARRGAGRPKGAKNKVTAKVKAAAQEYTSEAIETLATIMKDPNEPAAARVSAANSILDRAYGKPTQAIAGDDDNPLQMIITTGVPRTDDDPDN